MIAVDVRLTDSAGTWPKVALQFILDKYRLMFLYTQLSTCLYINMLFTVGLKYVRKKKYKTITILTFLLSLLRIYTTELRKTIFSSIKN